MSQFRISKLLFKLLVVLVFIGSIGSILVIRASAASFSVSIDPPLTYIEATTPQPISIPLQLTNQADSPVTLTTLFKPFTAKNELGEVYLTNDALPIEQFVKILYKDRPVQEIALPPHQSIELILQINIPKDNSDLNRDYYFSVIFQAKNSLVSKTSQSGADNEVIAFSQVVPAIATNIILTTKPPDSNQIVNQFQTATFYESGPIPFSVRTINNSPTVTFTEGQVLIKNLFGQTVGKIDLPRQYVLAKTSRIYPKISWPETFLVGPYIATLYLNTPGQTQVLTTTFLALPYQVAAALAMILWIAVWVAIRVRQRLIYPHSHKPK